MTGPIPESITVIANDRSGGSTRHWTRLSLILAVAAVLVGAAWLGLILLPRPPADDSAEAGFARDMAVHHAQAVEMALVIRDRTQDPEMRAVATDIVLTQQAQIGQMQGWLDAWGLPANGDVPPMAWMGHAMDGRMPGMATPDDIARLSQLPVDEAEVLFLRLMIRHHQAGVTMAEAVLQRTDRTAVQRLAQAIVAAQQAEITAMQDMLDRRGLPRVTDEPPLMAEMSPMEHDDGFLTSAWPTLRSTLRLSPLFAALFAVGWLVSTVIGGRQRSDAFLGLSSAHPTWQAVTAGALFASGVLHLGLAPEHFQESFMFGVFFTVAATAEAFLAAAVVTRPSRRVYQASIALTLLLVSVYALFRLVPPPGATSPESIDLIGLATKAVELVAVGAASRLLVRVDDGRSLGGDAIGAVVDHRGSKPTDA